MAVRSRKAKLKEAKAGGPTKKSSTFPPSFGCKSTLETLARLAFLAIRTALLVILLRFVFFNDAHVPGDKETAAKTGSSPVAVKGVPAVNAQPKAASPPPPPPKTEPPKPVAPVTSLRVWEWKNDGGDPLLFSQEAQLQPYYGMMLLGDTTMSKMAGPLIGEWTSVFPGTFFPEKAPNCRRVEYMRLTKGTWTRPDYALGEGPNVAGSRQPFCGDCDDCKSGKIGSNGKPYNWEYLFTEYARDVEMPTKDTKTSQETVALYLKKNPQASRLCVLNIGLMDMALPGITVDIFIKNAKDFLNLISPHCQTIVWTSMTSTQTSNTIQTNAKIDEWNKATKQALAQDSVLLSKVVFLDVYQASLKAANADALHKENAWYTALSKLFVAPIKKVVKG